MEHLNRLQNYQPFEGPLFLIIMDGIGLGKEYEGNAVFMAKTPTLDKLLKLPLSTKLKAHGTAVGLPTDDDMGNSEVGHNALGAGRVFEQGAKLVNRSIETKAIFNTDLWKEIIRRGNEGKTVHFLGLLSDGNVHSHINQLFALINQCSAEAISRVRLHVLLDGRDVGEKSAVNYLQPTEELLYGISKEKGYDYQIASGGGRMVTTMDRYKADWDIVKRGWDTHVNGIGRKFSSATEAVKTFYEEDPRITDQYLKSFVVVDSVGEPVGKINDGDVVIFFNFRGDRAIEISMAFDDSNFKYFDRGRVPENVLYAGMMEYDGDLHIPKNYLVLPPAIDETLGQYLCGEKITSFAISETQKYGHVTYFWNGNKSGYINDKMEYYFEIPSDRIEFDKAPKMKAAEITEKAIELLKSGKYKFGRINFANGDMVGHTGVMEAAIEAVEIVDTCLNELLIVIDELKGIAIITADHGNADEMFTIKKGKKEVKTSHTLNPVPFVIYDTDKKNKFRMKEINNAGLSNVAATIMNLLGFEKPINYDESMIMIDNPL